MKVLLLATSLAAHMVLSGCYALHYEPVKSGKPVLTGIALDRPYKITGHFAESGRHFYLFGGLIPITDTDVTRLLAPHLNGGDGIANLKAGEKFGLFNWAVNFLTVGILTSRSARVEGDVFIYTP
ncbi:MAG: hypothetical protein M1457_14180 [bacterium]|nr:hypothetical protein [bacterium]